MNGCRNRNSGIMNVAIIRIRPIFLADFAMIHMLRECSVLVRAQLAVMYLYLLAKCKIFPS